MNDRDLIVEMFDRAEFQPIILENSSVLICGGRCAAVFKFSDEGDLDAVEFKSPLSDEDLADIAWLRTG